MNASPLHERLLAAAGSHTYRSLGELTGTHPETVRRYMQGQAPSSEFLTAVCRALKVSGDWLLTGRGPMKAEDIKAHALSQADPSDLLTAMASTIEKLLERIDRLELYCQTLETRLHAAGGGLTSGRPTLGPERRDDRTPAHPTAARFIADALAPGSRPDAR